jgi:hypothetical protein
MDKGGQGEKLRVVVDASAAAKWAVPESFKIAAATKITTYDSAYIYVSKKVGAKLVTAVSELKQKGGSGGDHNP